MLVYLAGPISSGPERYLENAIEVANEVIDRGHNPYVPNLMYYLEAKKPREYETWMRLDEEWLLASDAVYRIPGESPGADREMQTAKEFGIMILKRLEDLDFIQDPRKGIISLND